jgi:hypothetical protein
MVRTTTFWTDHQPLKRHGQCRTDVQDLFLQRRNHILQEEYLCIFNGFVNLHFRQNNVYVQAFLSLPESAYNGLLNLHRWIQKTRLAFLMMTKVLYQFSEVWMIKDDGCQVYDYEM